MKKLLFILLLPLFSSAQILVMDVVQIKKGKAMDYESVEAFISPVQKQAIEDGKKWDGMFLKMLEVVIYLK